MIEIARDDFVGDRRDKFAAMMDSSQMSDLLTHLEQNRDAELALSAWLDYSGRPAEAGRARETAKKFGFAHEVLAKYAVGEIAVGSVKIITKA
jgi:hypothetical protein